MERAGGSMTNQRPCYSGHKRFHALSYQTLTTTDGLTFAVYETIVGRHHDLTTLCPANCTSNSRTDLRRSSRVSGLNVNFCSFLMFPMLTVTFVSVNAHPHWHFANYHGRSPSWCFQNQFRRLDGFH